MTGRILAISGPTVRTDLRGLSLYERVSVGDAMLTGEVVKLADDHAVIQVYENTSGLAVGEPVKATGSQLSVRLDPSLLGELFDGLQRPLPGLMQKMGPFITGAGELYGEDYPKWPVRLPRPFQKKFPPHTPLITGQRIIDFLFPIAKGGTAIFPGGFGTGKTILEQSIAKYADVDVVIYVGCGERGNEMAEMIDEFRQLIDPWKEKPLMERTILVVNTSNMPVAAREASIYTAVTMAEYYRDIGYHVLLLADSLSRWAEALREISSSLQEMPGEEGYPTYLGSRLSGFFERAGVVETSSGKTGSVTMILSVSPPGGDFTEPVTQACLRTSGAFLMLDTALAHKRHFPAINWFQSYSLYSAELAGHFREHVSPEWELLRQSCRQLLQKEETLKEVSEIVGIEGLQDSDRLIMHTAEKIRTEFLQQNAYSEDAFSAPEATLALISGIMKTYDRELEKLKKEGSSEEAQKEAGQS